MRLIVVVLLLLCSVRAVAQPSGVAQLERGNAPEPSTLDAHRCQDVAYGKGPRDPVKPEGSGLEPNPHGRHASRWLRWAK